MFGIENKLLCLKLNKKWVAIDITTVGAAIVDLAGGKNCYAVDIDYELKEDGTPDTSKPKTFRTLEWEEWIELPIRPWDFSISSIKMEIRVPTVLITKNYSKIPEINFGKYPNAQKIRIRDNNVCQYTGKKLSKEEISIDHVIPRGRGGDNSWENLVTTSKEINSMKGNKLNSEIGLKLIRKPEKPKSIPRSKLIREIRHMDWQFFVNAPLP